MERNLQSIKELNGGNFQDATSIQYIVAQQQHVKKVKEGHMRQVQRRQIGWKTDSLMQTVCLKDQFK